MASITIKISGKSKKIVKQVIFELLVKVVNQKIPVKITTDNKQYKKMYGN